MCVRSAPFRSNSLKLIFDGARAQEELADGDRESLELLRAEVFVGYLHGRDARALQRMGGWKVERGQETNVLELSEESNVVHAAPA